MKRDIKALISQMTLEEKASLCSGSDFWHTKEIERLGIPRVMLSDGPHGLRKQDGLGDHLGLGESIKATCFPAACAAAASFDVDLLESVGETLGEECQAENLSVLLGPASNIKRSPLCGRNFEYFSEDPYLTGKLSAAHIRGVQKWGVGTSMKHFACNNQEYKRMSCSSEVDERTLREIYLTGFEIAVKEAQPKTIMCSYNKINGTFASQNKKLLTDILRDEWGFEGYVVTDWGAVADRVEGIRAGLDLEMPGSNGENDALIVQAVKDGTLDEALLDRAVENILRVTESYLENRHPEAVYDREKDHEKAIAAAKECAVLLENNGILPLNPNQKVVYIGEYAVKPRFQGGGSSHINCSHVSAAYDTAMDKKRKVSYAKGFSADRDVYDEALAKEAIEAARSADVAVIFAGLPDSFESEGFDREHMRMPSCQNRLIEEIAAVQPNTVVVLHNGAPVECPWADKAAGILEMYLAGQGVGAACDALLYGEANPCGRLAETFPYHLEDNPSYLYYFGDGLKTDYREGVYVGYRYYEKKQLPVRWAFGHGLSYTTFAYGNLKLSKSQMKDEERIRVSVDVTNTGTIAGKEVIQLYVSDRTGTFGRPVKELKGFSKVYLAPGETKTVTMELDYRSLAYFHVELNDWYAKTGTYKILVGHASDDIRAEAELYFETEKLLPFSVDKSTTIGQLMEDPRTGEAIKDMVQRLSARSSAKKQAQEQSESDAKMVEEMMLGMPLKSLVSYRVMTDTQVNELIAFLNQLICKKKAD